MFEGFKVMDMKVFTNNTARLASKFIPSPNGDTELSIFFGSPEQTFFSGYSTLPVPMVFTFMDRGSESFSNCGFPLSLSIVDAVAENSSNIMSVTGTTTETPMFTFISNKRSITESAVDCFSRIRIYSRIITSAVMTRYKTSRFVLRIKFREFLAAATSALNYIHRTIIA